MEGYRNVQLPNLRKDFIAECKKQKPLKQKTSKNKSKHAKTKTRR